MAVTTQPPQHEVDVALRDGTTARVRPVAPSDAIELEAFLRSLSPTSRLLRFFGAGVDLHRAAEWAADVDYPDRFGLIARSRGEIVAHAAWAGAHDGRAEVAFEVRDELHGHGLATLLLAHLAHAAHAAGIDTFTAEVCTHNRRMLDVFRNSGLPVHTELTGDGLHVEFPTAMTPAARERFALRERTAAVGALDHVLRPRSVAVIGASRDPGSVGGALLANIEAAGFHGAVHAVNRGGTTIHGRACHRSIADVPEPVELAVIAVPAAQVVDVSRDCAAAGVRALVVVSAGFSEIGAAGVDRERELLTVCREAGMRLVGPNCLGVLNADPEVALNATFARHAAPPGNVAFMSQSGGVGIALLERARGAGLGVSAFLSVGNKADISGNDVIQWCEDDAHTRVVLLYLEGFGNPRKFGRIAQRVSRSKPIVALKAGQSRVGARAAASHTGALLAASDVTVDAVFEHAGVIRVTTIAELLDTASVLARQPLPRGPRVAVITNAGGPAILCADACEAAGLDVPALSPELRARLADLAPAEASLTNPVDLLAAVRPHAYEAAISAIAGSGEVDAVIAIFVPPLLTEPSEVAAAIGRAASAAPADGVPVVTALIVGEPPGTFDAGPSPVFAGAEEAAQALGRVARYAAWRARPEDPPVEIADARHAEAAALIAEALSEGAEWLDPPRVARLLACYGIPLVPQRTVRTAAEAASAAAEFGGPVAMKAFGPGIVHKRELGAVALNLGSAGAVRAEIAQMGRALAAAGRAADGFVIQPMIAAGVEMLVGVVQDPAFGPLVACGAGGEAAELLGDVRVRLAPVGRRAAAEMVRELRTFGLLAGHRGNPPADIAALEDVIVRIGAMADAHPQVAEIDLNPVLALPAAALAVDARVRLAPAAPPSPEPALRPVTPPHRGEPTS